MDIIARQTVWTGNQHPVDRALFGPVPQVVESWSVERGTTIPVVYLGVAGNSDGPVRSRSRRVNQPVSASQIRVPEPDVTLSAYLRAYPARLTFR